MESAMQKLGYFLLQEGIFLYGVKDQVKWVETELRRLQSFLEDANDKQKKGDKRVKNWVREVTDVSYDAEDAIDTYILQVEHQQQRQGLFGCIDWFASIPSLLMARYKLGKDIEEIKLKIDQILESATRYKIGPLDQTSGKYDQKIDELLELRKLSPPLDADDYTNIVGFEVHCQGLVNQLLSSNTKRRFVVSIVGMGGLGKTTLAKMVYDDSEISSSFPIRIWVTVSQDFVWRSFLEEIARKTIGTTGGGGLEERVHDFLKNKVYFIVIDDVWGTDVWQKIKTVLPDVGNGSRVLLTTRSELVAISVERIIPFFRLPLLDDEESWDLFVRKAFPTEQGVDSVCPKELEEMGRRMVKRCGRLPLALRVLGGLLSSKTTRLSWLQVEETMNWESIDDGQRCLNVLALSYRNLPDHNLRSCFLYIALFPEDSVISASELTRLWIAEGFIPQKRRETLEDTARGYLENFNQRSMIQVLRRKLDGSISKFKLHDLLREMCLAEAEEKKFFNINPSSSDGTRRLAFYNPREEICLPSNLRSLFLRSRMPTISICKMLHSLKFLRVLDLNARKPSEVSPKPINSMTHLRYLKLGTSWQIFWEISIGNFRNLQTLDLKWCFYISMLPKELGELPNLRYLFLYRFEQGNFPAIRTSTKLQTLKEIKCDELWAQESLPRLQDLRRLSICLCSGNTEVLCDSISKLNHLASLSVLSGEIPQSIITSSSDNPHLVKLNIRGRWAPQAWLPESNNFPQNLTKLILDDSRLERDPMPVLEKLPNLMFLCLDHYSYVGNKMVCTTDGFPRLQELRLWGLKNLQDLIVEAGAFPKLARLRIHRCNSLEMLPQGLQQVKSLMMLEVIDERAEFRDRLRKDVGADWYKIKHVPTIIIKKRHWVLSSLNNNEYTRFNS